MTEKYALKRFIVMYSFQTICTALTTLGLLAPAIEAQPASVEVVGTTSTQAVLRYTAPDSAACTLEVSEESDFTPLHADVDPAKYSGSNTDGGGPLERKWVIGKRGRYFVTDGGDVESRALRAAFPYFGRISCTGGSETFTFTTGTTPWGNVYEEPVPPINPGDKGVVPTPPLTGRWEGADVRSGAYFTFPVLAPGDTDIAIFNGVVGLDEPDDNANWTNETTCDSVDGTDCTTSSTDPLTLRNTDANGVSAAKIYVLLKDAEFDHSGAEATRTAECRYSFNNGVDWSNWIPAVVPAVGAAADVACGAGVPGDWAGLETAKTWTAGKGKIIDDSGDAAASTTIEFENNSDGQDDCDGLLVGSSMQFSLPVQNDTATTYTVQSKSCGSTPPSVVINTAVDLHNGGNGIPWAVRGNAGSNDRLVVQVRRAAAATGTLSVDAIQWHTRGDAPFGQVSAGFLRECGYTSPDGWTLCYGAGATAGTGLQGVLYAFKRNGRKMTINLYDGAYGSVSSACGSGFASTMGLPNWSRDDRADAWRTRYGLCGGGNDTLYKMVFGKTDPETPKTAPLGEQFSVLKCDSCAASVVASNIRTYVEAFAAANGLDYNQTKLPNLAYNGVIGGPDGDIAVFILRAGNQDTPGIVLALDIGDGSNVASSWTSQIDGGSDPTETDGSGLIVGWFDGYRQPVGYAPWHSSEMHAAVDAGIEQQLIHFGAQVGKYRHNQPSFRALVKDTLGAVSTETPNQTFTIASPIPTGVSPTCGQLAGCSSITLSCTGTNCTCSFGCKYSLDVGYTVTVGGEDQTVTSLNANGSVTIDEAFAGGDPSSSAFTFTPAAPSGWVGGDPISGGLLAGAPLPHWPHFGKPIETGDHCFLVNGDVSNGPWGAFSEHCEVTGISDNGDGTQEITVTRHTSWPSSGFSRGPYAADASWIGFESPQYLAGGKGQRLCKFFGDPLCASQTAMERGCCHNQTKPSDTDAATVHMAAGGIFVQRPVLGQDGGDTHVTEFAPAFAGEDVSAGDGNSAQKHPQLSSCDPARGGFCLTAMDDINYMGGNGTQNNTAYTLVSGRSNTYKVNQSIVPKHYGIYGFVGSNLMKMKSGPGATLSDADEHQMCFAVQSDECVAGSSPGDLYFVSSVMSPSVHYCLTTEHSNFNVSGRYDGIATPCIQPVGGFIEGKVQMYLRRGFDGSNVVRLGGAGARSLLSYTTTGRDRSVFNSVQALTEEMDWSLAIISHRGGGDYALVESPPLAPDSSNDPMTFLPVPINFQQVDGAADAYVEFGYGDPDGEFRCRPFTYLGKCIAEGATINEANPFLWEGETITGIGFTDGRATITIPALPNRVLFYRVVQRDGSENVIHTGSTEILATR